MVGVPRFGMRQCSAVQFNVYCAIWLIWQLIHTRTGKILQLWPKNASLIRVSFWFGSIKSNQSSLSINLMFLWHMFRPEGCSMPFCWLIGLTEVKYTRSDCGFAGAPGPRADRCACNINLKHERGRKSCGKSPGPTSTRSFSMVCWPGSFRS